MRVKINGKFIEELIQEIAQNYEILWKYVRVIDEHSNVLQELSGKEEHTIDEANLMIQSANEITKSYQEILFTYDTLVQTVDKLYQDFMTLQQLGINKIRNGYTIEYGVNEVRIYKGEELILVLFPASKVIRNIFEVLPLKQKGGEL